MTPASRRPDGRAATAAATGNAPAALARAGGIHPKVLVLASAAAIALYAGLLPAGASRGAGAPALFAVLVAASLSSIGGFAFSAISAALLLHLGGDHVRMVQILVVCSITIQALSVWSLRRDTDLRALLPFLLGGLVTLPLGVHLLLSVSHRGYGVVMGVLLLCYGGWMLLRRPLVLPRGRHAWIGDALAGAAGGITGGLAAFPGALVTVWCGMQGWPKERQRGVYQPFILTMQLATLGTLQLLAASEGRAGRLDLGATAAFVVPALFGTLCGLSVFRRLTDRQFGTAVNLLLIASGIGLLI